MQESSMQESSQNKLIETYQNFPGQFKSVILGTVSSAGVPQASYAPCVLDHNRNIYIFVSGLSAHTPNLMATGKASTLFIEDESQTPQIFARKRLSYDCIATLVDRENERWQAIAQQFSAAFGDIIEVMKDLADFRIFQLCPQSGRFVVGFGRAYDVDPANPSQLIHQNKS